MVALGAFDQHASMQKSSYPEDGMWKDPGKDTTPQSQIQKPS